jgi:predicted MFS family arabinose efflux permease
MVLLGIDPLMGVLISVFMMGIMWGAITVLDPIMAIKVPEDSRGGHLSVYLIAESLAMAPMPFIGGMLYDHVGPEYPFIVAALAAAALLVIVLVRRDMTSTLSGTSS